MVHRVPIINKDRCKPTKCKFECGLICPSNQQGKQCIEIIDIEDTGKKKQTAKINEDLCIGCGLCSNTKRGCPFNAIQMVNIPTQLEEDEIHRYGPNGFRLYRMPILKPNQVIGLLGQNGIGKSTIVNILSNKIKPSTDILSHFKGSELHKYISRLYANDLKISVKPQQVDLLIPFLKKKGENPTVKEFLISKIPTLTLDHPTLQLLELIPLFDSYILTLSGGEFQRCLCAITLLTPSDVYIFDEPSNYLDVRMRMRMASLIQQLVNPDIYVLVIEHDLTILDYTSDSICLLYGHPSAYGIVSHPMSTPNAINTYFEGYIASENMRFRESGYNLTGINIPEPDVLEDFPLIDYPGGMINYNHFSLEIIPGKIPSQASMTIILGENGTGKTTFINYLASSIGVSVSHKPQYLSIESNGTYPTVNDFLLNTILSSYTNPLFISDVVKPLSIDKIKDRRLNELSGGECQRLFIVKTLGTPAHFYLIDEPSSNLDIEQRVIITKVLKRFTIHNRKIMFIVEHDMMMALALGAEANTQVILMERNGNSSIAQSPMKFENGINTFLKRLGITFRSETLHSRPRINKLDSLKDREQKQLGIYYK